MGFVLIFVLLGILLTVNQASVKSVPKTVDNVQVQQYAQHVFLH